MTEQTACLTLAALSINKLAKHDVVRLYEAAGSALEVIENRHSLRDIEPEANDKLQTLLGGDISYYVQLAEQEEEWCANNKVEILTIGDKRYPSRLGFCPDAPLALFFRGRCDLNSPHIVNIVGTRKCTTYSADVIKHLVRELHNLCPDVMIVSGLAYGVDILAHRAAMDNDMTTVGVVAHGQDRLYPPLHRADANKMVLGKGGVVTEFFHGTSPEPRNFLQRNRIIAGMADASIIIESAERGGGLATIRLAGEYGREAFAVPGPINAEYSKGCNNLIRDHKAILLTSAKQIVDTMNWELSDELAKARQQGIERSLFLELNNEEQLIVDALKEHGDINANNIMQHTGLATQVVTGTLFKLEMKGIVKLMAGNTYHFLD